MPEQWRKAFRYIVDEEVAHHHRTIHNSRYSRALRVFPTLDVSRAVAAAESSECLNAELSLVNTGQRASKAHAPKESRYDRETYRVLLIVIACPSSAVRQAFARRSVGLSWRCALKVHRHRHKSFCGRPKEPMAFFGVVHILVVMKRGVLQFRYFCCILKVSNFELDLFMYSSTSSLIVR